MLIVLGLLFSWCLLLVACGAGCMWLLRLALVGLFELLHVCLILGLRVILCWYSV